MGDSQDCEKMAGFLEKNLNSLSSALERIVTDERLSRKTGFLHRVDPGWKIAACGAALLFCSISQAILALAALLIIAAVLAVASGIPLAAFVRRVFIFVPLFTIVIAVPAVFLTPGTLITSIGPLHITSEGTKAAAILILRVSASISFVMLLVLTTPWNEILAALRRLKIPAVAVCLMSLCYRYLLVLLKTLKELLMARRSRILSTLPFREEASFTARSVGYLFARSLSMGENVHMAMVSRGWNADEENNDKRETHEPDHSGPGEGMKDFEQAQSSNIPPAFELRGVSYAYPGRNKTIDIEYLDIPLRKVTMILGSNGSGKSTLLKILDGLIFPQQGTVSVLGEPFEERTLQDDSKRRKFRSRVGLVFQDPDAQCFSPTVREEIVFGPSQMGLDRSEIDRRLSSVLETLRLERLADRYPFHLSEGEKKRLALASVLAMDHEIFLLDEPTASLDPATESLLIDILSDIASKGRTIVIATQDLLLCRHIGEIAVILGPDGRCVFSGPLEKALSDIELLERTGLSHEHRRPHRHPMIEKRHSHYKEETG